MDLGYFCRHFSKFVLQVIYLVELDFHQAETPPRSHLRTVLTAVDRMLMLLGLSAAFDAVDYKVLRD